MKYVKHLLAVAVVGFGLFTLAAPNAQAQVQVGVGVGVGPAYGGYNGYDAYGSDDPYYSNYGPPPDCVYGYYPSYPYACAPYGYWGPEYFYNNVFVGVGPWFGWTFGPGFRGWFRSFDDFRRFGGFRGERFHSFWGGGGYREFHGGNAFRGGTPFRGGNQFRGGAPFRGGSGFNGGGFRGPGVAPGAPRPGGNAFRGAPPTGNFRAAPPAGGFRGQAVPRGGGGFSGGAPRSGGSGGFRSGGGGGHAGGGHGGGHR